MQLYAISLNEAAKQKQSTIRLLQPKETVIKIHMNLGSKTERKKNDRIKVGTKQNMHFTNEADCETFDRHIQN